MKFAATLLAVLATTAATPALAAARLSGDVAPVAYDITVTPDAKALTFSGRETVSVDVKKATSSITLNAAALKLSSATLDGKPVRFATDEAAQQLTLTLPTPVAAGRHTLAFAWTGTINRSAAGLFAIDYSNDDGSAARMLVTQFEAPDARRFAPMWDEPGSRRRSPSPPSHPATRPPFPTCPQARSPSRATARSCTTSRPRPGCRATCCSSAWATSSARR